MKRLPNLAGLEGLLDLDRRGVDIRPTLLRVITDQYLQSTTHTPDEERQFTELALRLLAETDMSTRAVVAARLAHHAAAPRTIVLQLARDVIDVAEPILLYSSGLTSSDLAEIVDERGPAYAAVIARRVGRPIAPGVAEPVQAMPAPAPAASPALAPSNAPAGSTPTNPEAVALCEIFYKADAEERRLIVTNLDYAITTPATLPVTMARFDIWRLEASALQHNTEAVVRDIERALGVSRRQARLIVEDPSGEPVVVAARAMDLPPAVLQRILLFMNPHIGQSVGRVYDLAALYSAITRDAALRLVAIWRDADPVAETSGTNDAAQQTAADQDRRTSSDARRAVSHSDAAPAVTRPAPSRVSGSEPR